MSVVIMANWGNVAPISYTAEPGEWVNIERRALRTHFNDDTVVSGKTIVDYDGPETITIFGINTGMLNVGSYAGATIGAYFWSDTYRRNRTGVYLPCEAGTTPAGSALSAAPTNCLYDSINDQYVEAQGGGEPTFETVTPDEGSLTCPIVITGVKWVKGGLEVKYHTTKDNVVPIVMYQEPTELHKTYVGKRILDMPGYLATRSSTNDDLYVNVHENRYPYEVLGMPMANYAGQHSSMEFAVSPNMTVRSRTICHSSNEYYQYWYEHEYNGSSWSQSFSDNRYNDFINNYRTRTRTMASDTSKYRFKNYFSTGSYMLKWYDHLVFREIELTDATYDSSIENNIVIADDLEVLGDIGYFASTDGTDNKVLIKIPEENHAVLNPANIKWYLGTTDVAYKQIEIPVPAANGVHFMHSSASTATFPDSLRAMFSDNKFTVEFMYYNAASTSSTSTVRLMDLGEQYIEWYGNQLRVGGNTYLDDQAGKLLKITITGDGSTLRYYVDGNLFASETDGDLDENQWFIDSRGGYFYHVSFLAITKTDDQILAEKDIEPNIEDDYQVAFYPGMRGYDNVLSLLDLGPHQMHGTIEGAYYA